MESNRKKERDAKISTSDKFQTVGRNGANKRYRCCLTPNK